MRVLTAENTSYDIDLIPEMPQAEAENYRYCIFDGSDEEYADYYWLPPVFLEGFTAPAACCQIGPYNIQMSIDWAIVTTDPDFGGLEITPLTSPLLHRGDIVAPVFNPLKSWMPRAETVQITNVYQDVKWFFPKLKSGHLLVVPLEEGDEPKCALFVHAKEINKVKNLDFSDLL